MYNKRDLHDHMESTSIQELSPSVFNLVEPNFDLHMHKSNARISQDIMMCVRFKERAGFF